VFGSDAAAPAGASPSRASEPLFLLCHWRQERAVLFQRCLSWNPWDVILPIINDLSPEEGGVERTGIPHMVDSANPKR